METIVPLSHAMVLYHLSCLSLFTGIVGLSYGKPVLGSGVLIGSVLAQNYWRYPTYGWRRTLDIAWVQLLILTHLWYVWATPVSPFYGMIQGLGVVFYGASWYYQQKNLECNATLCHAMVHVCANGSLLLYYLN